MFVFDSLCRLTSLYHLLDHSHSKLHDEAPNPLDDLGNLVAHVRSRCTRRTSFHWDNPWMHDPHRRNCSTPGSPGMRPCLCPCLCPCLLRPWHSGLVPKCNHMRCVPCPHNCCISCRCYILWTGGPSLHNCSTPWCLCFPSSGCYIPLLGGHNRRK